MQKAPAVPPGSRFLGPFFGFVAVVPGGGLCAIFGAGFVRWILICCAFSLLPFWVLGLGQKATQMPEPVRAF